MKSITTVTILFCISTLFLSCDSQVPKPKKEASTQEPPIGMVWIPEGTFMMGSEGPQARPDESPVHPVKVDGFWIDQTEVTNAQFAAFVEAT